MLPFVAKMSLRVDSGGITVTISQSFTTNNEVVVDNADIRKHESTDATKKPLLLLDFDDVLNIPLSNPLKENSDYKWRRKSGWDFDAWSSQKYLSIYDNDNYIITTNTEMIEALCSLEDEGLCEIVWLTTWVQHTGIPKVLIDYDDILSADLQKIDGASGLQRRYDFLTKIVGRQWRAAGGFGPQHPKYIGSQFVDQWWKWSAVQSLRRRDYELVFADDMFSVFPQLRKAEEKSDEGLKLIRVKPSQGLRRNEYEDIRSWLEEQAENKG